MGTSAVVLLPSIFRPDNREYYRGWQSVCFRRHLLHTEKVL